MLTDLGLTQGQIIDNVTLLALPEQTIKETHEFLARLGLNRQAVLAFPQLLSLNRVKLENNHRSLVAMGLAGDLNRYPALLYRSPGTLRKNLALLKDIGLTHEKILADASLFASNPETIEEHWNHMRSKGLSDHKIVTNAHLLQMNPRTISRNYQNLRRFFEQDKIATFAPLLGIPTKTIESNVQFLTSLGIDYTRYPLLCSTSPRTKRQKIAWLAKSLSDRKLVDHEQQRTLQDVCRLVRENPKLLVYSITTLEKMREKLKAKVRQ